MIGRSAATFPHRCPNCFAPNNGSDPTRCEYCGTWLMEPRSSPVDPFSSAYTEALESVRRYYDDRSATHTMCRGAYTQGLRVNTPRNYMGTMRPV